MTDTAAAILEGVRALLPTTDSTPASHVIAAAPWQGGSAYWLNGATDAEALESLERVNRARGRMFDRGALTAPLPRALALYRLERHAPGTPGTVRVGTVAYALEVLA